MSSQCILLHRNDNVATALTDLPEGSHVLAELGGVAHEIVLIEAVAFAQKFALCDIAAGEPVLKYGLPIGQATQPIPRGAWVHVHNCRSTRHGFHRDQYGDKA